MRFSANLGFLWSELALPDAIRAAYAAGFDAVECHWPYEIRPVEVARALHETGLTMLGLNTRRGNPGENGLSALPGREDEARAAIDQAFDYAQAIGAPAVHVMAGIAQGEAAHHAFLANLRHASDRAEAAGITVLIEPLNRYDAPGYFLRSGEQAAGIIAELGRPAVRLMFDCYHLQIAGGDICRRFERLLPMIGHVQIASVPARAAPDGGELNYTHVLRCFAELGWHRPIGAEYKPNGSTDATLGWLPEFKRIGL
ncbi:MAG: TIM barrel protein [Paracoccaceae bacterium]